MADNAMHEDKDASAFFDEVEKEKKNDYETCSASQAFDAVFQCYIALFLALGSQAINYYRYGTKKDCSGKWDDFKFCLKTKTKSSEIADAMIKEHQAVKDNMKKRGRNSEEVWEARQ
ncbi:hypothetical protein INT46_001475 [Mucor plumbeus]|uniref:Early meiotic induction protein 1 n=1 Tax=Mucor plumbeus TaxID=97098 RepID=A0A8H7VHZ0_9FUNG|nr:hypothetical protein INT46_001475 [Mucor plumbeus]